MNDSNWINLIGLIVIPCIIWAGLKVAQLARAIEGVKLTIAGLGEKFVSEGECERRRDECLARMRKK